MHKLVAAGGQHVHGIPRHPHALGQHRLHRLLERGFGQRHVIVHSGPRRTRARGAGGVMRCLRDSVGGPGAAYLYGPGPGTQLRWWSPFPRPPACEGNGALPHASRSCALLSLQASTLPDWKFPRHCKQSGLVLHPVQAGDAGRGTQPACARRPPPPPAGSPPDGRLACGGPGMACDLSQHGAGVQVQKRQRGRGLWRFPQRPLRLRRGQEGLPGSACPAHRRGQGRAVSRSRRADDLAAQSLTWPHPGIPPAVTPPRPGHPPPPSPAPLLAWKLGCSWLALPAMLDGRRPRLARRGEAPRAVSGCTGCTGMPDGVSAATTSTIRVRLEGTGGAGARKGREMAKTLAPDPPPGSLPWHVRRGSTGQVFPPRRGFSLADERIEARGEPRPHPGRRGMPLQIPLLGAAQRHLREPGAAAPRRPAPGAAHGKACKRRAPWVARPPFPSRAHMPIALEASQATPTPTTSSLYTPSSLPFLPPGP